MKLNRSRIIVLALLAVAAVALLVDRLLLAPSATGPKQALGASGTTPATTGVQESASAIDGDARPRFADRLRATAEQCELDPAGMRDGFTPAEAWLKELVAAPPPAESDPAPPAGPSPGDLFAQQHTLTSVIMTRSGGSAVVDGKVVPLKQTVDGFTLVRLTRDAAVFEAAGEQVELRLRRQMADQTDR